MPTVPAIGHGAEWSIGGVEGLGGAGATQDAPASGTGFDGMLGKQLGQLEGLQGEAAGAARALADGTATDVASAVMAVERARLSMQLASQIRTKAVDAYQDIFRTQV